MEPQAAQIAAAAPPGAEAGGEAAAQQQAPAPVDVEPSPAAGAAAEAPAAPQPDAAAPPAAEAVPAEDAAADASMAVEAPGEVPAAAQPLADGAEQLAGGGGEAKAEPAAAAPEQPAPAAATPAQPAAAGEEAAPAAAAAAQAIKPEPPSVAGSRGTSPPAGGAPQAATPADPAVAAAAAAAAAASSGGAPNSGGKGGRAGNKSDFQKEALEAAFAMNHYPTEEMKRVLGAKIGLTPNQVNGWFTRRRRKEKDAELEARVRAELEAAGGAPPAPAAKPPSATKPPASAAAAALVAEAANEAAAGAGAAAPAAAAAATAPAAGPSPAEVAAQAAAAGAGKAKEQAAAAEEEAPLTEAEQQKLKEYEELLEAARTHFGDDYREDGPPLGYEFDDAPILPGAGGLSTGSSGALGAGAGKKRKAAAAPSPLSPGFQDNDEDDPDFVMGAKRQRSKKDWESMQFAEEQRAAMLVEKARVQQERLAAQIRKEQERLLRDKEKADARVAKEREKELARLEAERRKHFERVQKEQKKLAAMQEREKERLDKIRAREEKKKEKEVQRALALQEKQAMRLRQREAAVTGPKDDLDIEWDGLIAAYRAQNGLPRDIALPADDDGKAPAGYPPLPRRPQFPPEHVAMVPALPPELPAEQGGALLTAWAFLHTFGPMLGTKAVTADELLASLAQGSSSGLLAELHCTLLRLIQADMEEAHATQYGPYATMPPEQRTHSRYFSAAHMLEEAWAWGYDIDSWRAHLNTLTWPEVARQLATVAGLGRRRPKPKKEEKPKMGQEGEDIIADETGDLKLSLPSRLSAGTVKAAAWQVLAEVGPEGMHLEDICREIQKRGYRDLRGSKTPESSIGAALSRDVLFVRVKKATYALQAIIAHHNQLRRAAAAAATKQEGTAETGGEGAAAEGAADGSAVKAEGEQGGQVASAGGEGGDPAGLRSPGGTKITVVKREEEEGQEQQGGEESEEEEEEEEKGEEEEEAQQLGEPWLEALAHSDYDALPLEQRVAMLCSLCHLAMDSPSIRDTLERRMEEQQRIKRQTFEEQRAEKRRRQAEAAAKAQAAAEEAQRALQRFQQQQQAAQAAQQGEQAQQQGQQAAEGAAAGGSEPAAPAGEGAAPMDVDAAQTITPQQEDDDGAAISPGDQAAGGAAGGAAAVPLDPAAAATAAAIAAAASKEGEDRVADAERARQRAEQARRDLEANSARLEPLGLDRRYNRYWRLPGAEQQQQQQQPAAAEQQQQQAGEEGGAAGKAAPWPATPALPPPVGDRLLVESQEDGSLSVITTKAALAALMAALERKGARESGLYASLIRHRAQLEAGMPAGPLALPAPEGEAAAQQAQQAEQTQRQALLDLPLAAPALQPSKLPGRASKKAKEAAAAEGALEEAAAADLAPLREGDSLAVTRIKVDLLRMLRGLPAAALEEGFNGAAWASAVRDAESTAVLRRLLGELEASVVSDRRHQLFFVHPPLVRGAWLPTAHEVADAITLAELPEAPSAAAGAAAGEGSPGGAGAAGEQQPAGGEQQQEGEQQEQQEDAEAEEEPLAWLPATLAAIGLRLRSLDAALLYGEPPQAAAREALPGYLFIQRPTEGGVVSGQPLDPGTQGRIKQSLFPPLPARLLYGPRTEFTFPKAQFEVDVASGSDALIATTAGRGGRGRGRGRGRGGRGGRGRGGRGATAVSAVAGDAAAAMGLGVGKKKRGKKGKAVGLVEKSALAKEFEKSDSEKHYGSDLDGEEEEEEGDEFASSLPAITAGSMDATGDAAVSGPASTAGDEEDEPLSGDEAISSEED